MPSENTSADKSDEHSPDLDSFEPNYHLPLSERLAINATAEITASRILCTSIGRGQCAIELAGRLPEADVTIHFTELFPASETAEWCDNKSGTLNVICSADLPDEEYDLCVLPMTKSVGSELSRDLLQQAYARLAEGGRLVVTTDNPKDSWFHHEIEKFSKNLTRLQKRKGVVYKLKKTKPLKKLKDFSCEFAFRDNENLIKVVSNAGVFSHRRLDLGARALMETMVINEGDHVLDIGCGAGTVGLAAAKRAADVAVHFVDSNARAVECAMRGAELNELVDFTGTLSCDGTACDFDGQPIENDFDVVVGNPPYYSNYQISEIFLQSAVRGLKAGGRVYIVSKNIEWLQARMEQLFDEVTVTDARTYTIISAVLGDGTKVTTEPVTKDSDELSNPPQE